MTERHGLSAVELEDYARGRLAGRAATRAAGHVAGCEECRGWLEAYELLAVSVAADRRADEVHPSSEALAALAADPEEVDDVELLEHTESCESCRTLVEVARSAIAKGAAGGSGDVRSHRQWVGLAAAAVLVAALALGLTAGLRTKVSEPQEFQQISGLSLTGMRQIEGERALSARSVQVESGAIVRFRAGDRVALENGFSVGSGAEFAVELLGPKGRREAEDRN